MACQMDVIWSNPIQQPLASFGGLKNTGTAERSRCNFLTTQHLHGHHHGQRYAAILNMYVLGLYMHVTLMPLHNSQSARVAASAGLNIHALCALCYECRTLTAPRVLQRLIFYVYSTYVCARSEGVGGVVGGWGGGVTCLFRDLEEKDCWH